MNRRLFLGTFCAFVLAMSQRLRAADSPAGLTLPALLSQIDSTQQRVQDIQFRFQETSQRSSFQPSITAGTVSFKRPYHLRVDQRTPEKQTMVSDGRALTIYSPGAGQEMTADWKAWVAQTHFPVLLLSFVGDFPVSRWPDRYDILFGGYDQHLYKIVFKPKKDIDAPLDLWVSDETFLPVRGHMQLDSASVEIAFKDVKMNSSLSDSLFALRVPAGTPVVPLSL